MEADKRAFKISINNEKEFEIRAFKSDAFLDQIGNLGIKENFEAKIFIEIMGDLSLDFLALGELYKKAVKLSLRLKSYSGDKKTYEIFYKDVLITSYDISLLCSEEKASVKLRFVAKSEKLSLGGL